MIFDVYTLKYPLLSPTKAGYLYFIKLYNKISLKKLYRSNHLNFHSNIATSVKSNCKCYNTIRIEMMRGRRNTNPEASIPHYSDG